MNPLKCILKPDLYPPKMFVIRPRLIQDISTTTQIWKRHYFTVSIIESNKRVQEDGGPYRLLRYRGG